jgi:hypothetical protein
MQLEGDNSNSLVLTSGVRRTRLPDPASLPCSQPTPHPLKTLTHSGELALSRARRYVPNLAPRAHPPPDPPCPHGARAQAKMRRTPPAQLSLALLRLSRSSSSSSCRCSRLLLLLLLRLWLLQLQLRLLLWRARGPLRRGVPLL